VIGLTASGCLVFSDLAWQPLTAAIFALLWLNLLWLL